jgi:hypothetical protein
MTIGYGDAFDYIPHNEKEERENHDKRLINKMFRHLYIKVIYCAPSVNMSKL